MPPRDIELSINEKNFVLEALKKGIRIDGREFDAFRDVKIEFGQEYGLVDITLGKTRVLARVSAEVSKPRQERPFEGLFTITTEMGPMASPVFEAGRQTEQELLLARLIEKSIRRSHALDTESLCIVSGKRCWAVRADCLFVSHDGNLVDASCLAVIAALSHFRRPDVTVSGDVITIHPIEEREPMPLSILHHPICVTFSFFLGGEVCLIDATAQEETLRDGDMSITINRNGELCQIAKAGGVATEAHVILRCAEVALVKVREISRKLMDALKEDAAKRNVGLGTLDLRIEGRSENER